MAQLEEGQETLDILKAHAKQRPWLVGAVALLACVCLVVAGFGWMAGQDETLVIEREADTDGAGGDDGTGTDVTDQGEADDEVEEPVEHITVVVDVSGAVVSPAVVTLPDGSRVDDAIRAAGGLTAEADQSAINRAAKLTDGQKIVVPRVGEALPATDATGTSTGTVTTEPALVNINTATAEELDELPGVGPATAEAIITDREESGPFASIEDLMRVSGIGEKKFEKLKNSICV